MVRKSHGDLAVQGWDSLEWQSSLVNCGQGAGPGIASTAQRAGSSGISVDLARSGAGCRVDCMVTAGNGYPENCAKPVINERFTLKAGTDVCYIRPGDDSFTVLILLGCFARVTTTLAMALPRFVSARQRAIPLIHEQQPRREPRSNSVHLAVQAICHCARDEKN